MQLGQMGANMTAINPGSNSSYPALEEVVNRINDY